MEIETAIRAQLLGGDEALNDTGSVSEPANDDVLVLAETKAKES